MDTGPVSSKVKFVSQSLGHNGKCWGAQPSMNNYEDISMFEILYTVVNRLDACGVK